MDGLVTIVIPCYNAEKYIAETIVSVINQTYTNWELIVVNDGSTDNSLNIIKEFAANDDRISFIDKKNTGVSDARNKGIALSKGKFIAFLDADDVWKSDFLKLVLARFSEDNLLGLVHSDNQIINEYSEKLNQINASFEGYVLDKLLLGGENEYIFAISSVVVKKEVIDNVGQFDVHLTNGADHEFYFRVAKKYKIGRVSKVGIYYRLHANNMHANIELLEKDTLAIYKKSDETNLFKNSTFRRKCISNIYLILAGSFWNDGDNKRKGIHYIIKSIITYPPVIFKLIKKIFN